MGGLFAHSLAVLTDAAHMLSDVLAFVISLCAGTYALRASKASHTFGYHRAEVLGSMVSLASSKLPTCCFTVLHRSAWESVCIPVYGQTAVISMEAGICRVIYVWSYSPAFNMHHYQCLASSCFCICKFTCPTSMVVPHVMMLPCCTCRYRC